MPDAVARSALERARARESGERLVVGVNAFTGPEEITVEVRQTAHPYDAERLARAEARQTAKLRALRRRRDGTGVVRALAELQQAAGHDEVPLVPGVIGCLRVDARSEEHTSEL